MQNQVEIRNKWFADQVGKLTESGMAQADIAEKLGVLPQYLNAILNNRRNASEKFVNKFCEKFNINQLLEPLLQKLFRLVHRLVEKNWGKARRLWMTDFRY